MAEEDMVVDARDPSKKHRPMMTTADLSLRFDPVYGPISRRFQQKPEEFAYGFARVWFKRTHRDMGPRALYFGPKIPAEELIWQDPTATVGHELIDASDIADPKSKILAQGLPSAFWGQAGQRQPLSAPSAFPFGESDVKDLFPAPSSSRA